MTLISPFETDQDATPLAPAERQGLIPTHVTTRAELNQLEQTNILDADMWAFGRKRDVVDYEFLMDLHDRMFGNVWSWAGARRDTERNLGSLPHLIEPELRALIDDAKYQVAHNSYPVDELAVRFHHRLVQIHPFPNGNGRWSRMTADLLIVRAAYIAALKAADNHDIGPLLKFARS
jgi:Fic-DOC domain mobile mystery protein B